MLRFFRDEMLFDYDYVHLTWAQRMCGMAAEPWERFNACEYLLDRHVAAGDGGRLAITGVGGPLTYAQLLDRVQRTAAGLRELGLQPEQRLVMFMADSPEFVAVYLAAMRIGAVPVPVSTMLHADGLAELLRDSRARMLAVTPQFFGLVAEAAAAAPELQGVLAAGGGALASAAVPVHDLDALVAAAVPRADVYPTTADFPAFWLYTSGTTGKSKGAMHRHGSVRVVCETYGRQVLGIRPGDRCLSAAKAFFAYGLGNSLLFPLSAGAVTVLEPDPARPEVVAQRVRDYGVTLFFAGPTFFATMLRAGLPADALAGVRLAASAGEALPAALYQRWTSYFGVDILDGLGMTEMLHIFLSTREGQVRPGTTGVAVPGYELKILDEAGVAVPAGPRAPCSSGAIRRRAAIGPVTRRPGWCSRVSGCALATHTSRTPMATTSASGAPATCSRPAASGYRLLRWRTGCWRTRRSRRPSWWPGWTRTGWRSRLPMSCSGPAPRRPRRS